MITVQMGDKDFINIGGTDAKPFHGAQGGRTAIQKQFSAGDLDQNAGLQSASATEGITAAKEFYGYGLHFNLWLNIRP